MDTPMPFPISKTKITPPQRRAELIARPRLIESLHTLLNKKLVLIAAPAGYGKTSLLIDFVASSEIPVCWLSLDILDQEPQRFLSYLIACLRERFPALGAESLALLSNMASIEKENERLAVILTNEIFQDIREHFAIILDDYQFIDPVPALRHFINRFIQLAGEHCHLVLVSRILPTLPDFHLLVARNQVGGLGLEDLAFLPEEIQALFAQNAAQTLSREEAEVLADETDGWITSISLTNLSFSKGRLRQKTPAARTGVELYDYFAREVLDRQTPSMRKFLLVTSLFEEVDIEICEAVLEPLLADLRGNWRALFGAVQKNNLFAIPMGSEGGSFRYHHLFQDYLQAILQEENPDIIREVMRRLAVFYEERQEWEKAHHIHESNDDLDALVALIEASGTHLIRNGRIATLGNWLDRLPVFRLQQNPRLLSLQGVVAHIRGETGTGIFLLNQAEKGLRAQNDVENLVVTLVRRAAAFRDSGDYARALSDAEEAIALTRGKDDPNAQYNLAAALRVKGMGLFRLGRTTESVEWLENSLGLFSALHDRNYIPILEMELGAVHNILGENEIAIKFYRSALKTWEASGNLGWQSTLMNNLGVLHHQRGEYEKAFQTLENAIECARRSDYVRTQAVALSSLGDLLLDLQEFEHARECYEQSLNLATQHQYSFWMFYDAVALARVARLSKQYQIAESLLQDFFARINQDVLAGEEALFRLEYGCLLLTINKPRQAAEELTLAMRLYEQDGRILEINICRLWLAASLIQSGQGESAFPYLRQFVGDYRSMQEPFPLHVTAGQAQHWFDKFVIPGDASIVLAQLFNKAKQFQVKIPALRRKLRQVSKSAFISPPHLTIQGFGPAQVLLNGKKVPLSDWQTRETRDLFFYFLQAPPQTKEDIAAMFWPDITPARMKMRFKTNMYRLRHAIGQNSILFEGERYLFNTEIDYDYDVENFKKLLKQSKDATSEERIPILEAVIALVKGPYLADIDAEWADAERAQLELDYHEALILLARLYLESSQPERAIAACQTVLKTDPYLEDAYRLSMRAYAALGDGAGVARVFQACLAVLQEELGVSPSVETEKLYRKLLKS
jgi:ATP/maltotriose-dependent transcriptional regulator MalT/two-component SAPR family response regulator